MKTKAEVENEAKTRPTMPNTSGRRAGDRKRRAGERQNEAEDDWEERGGNDEWETSRRRRWQAGADEDEVGDKVEGTGGP